MPPEPQNKQLPKRLGKEPLLEAVWELRFAGDVSTGQELPGLLLGKLRADYPGARIELRPLANVPPEFRNSQYQMRYGATHALPCGEFTILTGDNVVAVSMVKPYPGWDTFRKRISTLADWLNKAGVIRKPTAFSIRYVDFFAGSPAETLNLLAAEIRMGEFKPTSGELQLQMGVVLNEFQGSIQVLNPVTLPGGSNPLEKTGMVTDIVVNAALRDPENAWNDIKSNLNPAKEACHRLFFNLLKPETIKSLDPIYGE